MIFAHFKKGFCIINMNEISRDIRYRQTEEDLRDAFELLCLKKDPQKITVAEMAERTGVTRSTFYNHYTDMPTLITKIEDEILDEIFSMLDRCREEGMDDRKLVRSFFSALCRYIRKSGYLIRTLSRLSSVRFIEQALLRLREYVLLDMSHMEGSPARQQRAAYMMAGSIGGVVGILHKWTLENCEDAPESVAKLLTVVLTADFLKI